MKRLVFVCILAMAALGAWADVNIAGKWSGSFVVTGPDGDSHDSTAVLNLKQAGNDITGTIGPNEDQQWEVKNGKIDGGKITWEVQTDGPLLKFEAALEGEHLKGTAHASQNGQNMSAKLDVIRAK